MLLGSMAVLDAALALTTAQCRSALVVDDLGQLIGLVTLQDINRSLIRLKSEAQNKPPAMQQLATICTREVLSAYPDEILADALDRMGARGLHQLPVVERDNPYRVLGVLEQESIELACNLAATKEVVRQHLVSQVAATEIISV
jgi:CBS domain-containing protein